MFKLLPVRATGLNMEEHLKRGVCAALRSDPAWDCVVITDEADKNSPRWLCLGCKVYYSGSATRIKEHLLGLKKSKACDQKKATAAFREALENVKKRHTGKIQKKEHRKIVESVNAACEAGNMNVDKAARALSRANAGLIQPGICFDVSHGEHCDDAIAELFYACNIPAAVADHPKFIKVVKALRAAPSSYKPPDRHKLHGALLDSTVQKIRRRLGPLRQAAVKSCCTLLSDGWETVNHDHLINFLFGTARCIFFEGTVQLGSKDHETADFIAELMRQQMEAIGKLTIVQIVTDTCKVMQVCFFLPTSCTARLLC